MFKLTVIKKYWDREQIFVVNKKMYHLLKHPTIFLYVSCRCKAKTEDERSTYLDDSMVPDQFPHAVENEGETHAEHDQRENDQDYNDMLGIDQPRFLLL